MATNYKAKNIENTTEFSEFDISVNPDNICALTVVPKSSFAVIDLFPLNAVLPKIDTSIKQKI